MTIDEYIELLKSGEYITDAKEDLQLAEWLEELKAFREPPNDKYWKYWYNKGRANAIDDVTNKYFDAIEYVLHQKDIKLELNQALTIYARIMNKCNMIAEQLKDKTE